jgi:transposase
MTYRLIQAQYIVRCVLPQHVRCEMQRFSYPSDVSDAEWAILEPLLPAEKPGGRHRDVNLREIVNGILYILRGGCGWRMMPHDFAPWSTVYDYFCKWRLSGLWEQVNTVLRERVRLKMGRNATLSAAIIDSQTVKTRAGYKPYLSAILLVRQPIRRPCATRLTQRSM